MLPMPHGAHTLTVLAYDPKFNTHPGRRFDVSGIKAAHRVLPMTDAVTCQQPPCLPAEHLAPAPPPP
jgi:hypothetical protein